MFVLRMAFGMDDKLDILGTVENRNQAKAMLRIAISQDSSQMPRKSVLRRSQYPSTAFWGSF